jgi:zinc transporter ZupT
VEGAVLALVVLGAVMIAVATLAGAWLGRRNSRRELCFAAAAGALLVIALVHLLPDAWSAAGQVHMTWLVPVAAVASFAGAGLVVRRGCACQADCEAAGGAGTAGALAVHRVLEGAVLAIGGSVVVAVALFVHAFAEGLAAGTLLRSVPKRRAATLLAIMCLSPAVGAAIAGLGSFPPQAEPVLLALAAGVLGQAARVSFAAAFRDVRLPRLVTSSPAAATLAAAIVTTLAVRGVG